jgi:hypothetical protein
MLGCFKGMCTLLILATDPLAKFVAKRKGGIEKVLDQELGEEGWVSCGFWYRGVGPTKEECKGTAMVGVKKGVNLDGKMVKEKVGGKMEAEIVWREVGKW